VKAAAHQQRRATGCPEKAEWCTLLSYKHLYIIIAREYQNNNDI
jgi:hypothetical protein